MIFDPDRYLPLIERMTDALDQSAPLADCETAGRLRLLETFGMGGSHAELKKALKLGITGHGWTL